MIGDTLIRLDAVDSTNDAAARLAADGAPEGATVVAARQRAGRGRQGRPWHSPAAGNIYCSVVLRPPRPVPEWPDLSWVLAAGVAEFARDNGAPGALVKHPNDVLVGGRKLAGLLLESRTGSGGQGALIAGIGINLNVEAGDFPAELRESATSLRLLTGHSSDCDVLLERLFPYLDRWYALWCREGAPAAGARLESLELGAVASLTTLRGATEAPSGCGAVPGA